MKSNKPYENELELQLQEVSSEQPQVRSQSTADLELIMTNSAFGYEYALSALEEEQGVDEYGLHASQIQSEIEQFKDLYFDARSKLSKLDSSTLNRVEQDLQMQKLVIFTKKGYLH